MVFPSDCGCCLRPSCPRRSRCPIDGTGFPYRLGGMHFDLPALDRHLRLLRRGHRRIPRRRDDAGARGPRGPAFSSAATYRRFAPRDRRGGHVRIRRRPVLLLPRGATSGTRILAALPPRPNARADKFDAMLARWHAPLIIGIRFMYGFRIIGPVLLGMGRVSHTTFALYNALGALLWAPLIAGLGLLRRSHRDGAARREGCRDLGSRRAGARRPRRVHVPQDPRTPP